MMNVRLPVLTTVVETPEYLSRTRGLFDQDQRDSIVNMLAARPSAGDLIVGTGGGGARVIYFFHNMSVPVFLLTAFAKNDRSDLKQAERNELRVLTKALVETYERRVP